MQPRTTIVDANGKFQHPSSNLQHQLRSSADDSGICNNQNHCLHYLRPSLYLRRFSGGHLCCCELKRVYICHEHINYDKHSSKSNRYQLRLQSHRQLDKSSACR